MPKAIRVGALTFPTQKALRDRCREVLHGYALETPIGGDDVPFLLALLARHRQADAKVGCGVAHFFVRLTQYGNKGFYLRRVDGSITDFSFECCIKPPSSRTEALKGFRTAIQDQIQEFKQRAFRVGSARCALSGEVLSYKDAHVDHAPPSTFVSLVDAFLLARGITADAVKVNASKDNDTLTDIADPELRAAFQEYHRKHAVLRMLSAAANLRRGSAQ